MYELRVQTVFCAAHAIVIRGVREPVHGHNWRVVVTVAGAGLDGDGLLCDFHEVEAALREAVAPWHNRHLNEVPPFDAVNPTAELVAKAVWERVSARLGLGVRVASAEVSEAEGCVAVYRP